MSSPAELGLAEHGEDAGHSCLLENLCVGHFVLPLHFQQFAKAVEMETVEFLCVPLADGPGLAGI